MARGGIVADVPRLEHESAGKCLLTYSHRGHLAHPNVLCNFAVELCVATFDGNCVRAAPAPASYWMPRQPEGR
jgi:hypothetical protein